MRKPRGAFVALDRGTVILLGVILSLGATAIAVIQPSNYGRVDNLVTSIRSADRGPILSHPGDAPVSVTDADRKRILDNYGKLPLSFIENRGQVNERIAYYVQSPGGSLSFSREGHAMRVTQGKGKDARAHTIKVDLVDAVPERIEGLETASAVVSYFKGPQEEWKNAIPTHAKIGYRQAWPGIDLAYDGANGRLESIYTVAPHADPGQIKLRYSGHDSLNLDNEGNLVYATSLGEILETAPIAWQDIDGQRISVETRFALLGDSIVAIQVADYSPDHELRIDPTLVYAGYIGGSGGDYGTDIAVDTAGNAYLTGFTASTETSFPVTVGPDPSYNGGFLYGDAFVAKVNAAGTALVYAGYIGGSGDDRGFGIAVDSVGNAYVTGETSSTQATFPVITGPDLTHNSTFVSYDAFVAKVNAAGTALIYAGYIGGDVSELGADITVDSSGNAYVIGTTHSTEGTFPVMVGPDLTHNGSNSSDAFVAKVNAAGTALLYAGYIGGSGPSFGFGNDVGTAITVDSTGHAYVTGYTNSTESSFPVTLLSMDVTHNGGDDAFVAKLDPAGSVLVYCGYIGGSGTDRGYGIAVDGAGNAYVTGNTTSDEVTFPVQGGPDITYNGGTNLGDAFVAKLNSNGGSLSYAGYIGGSGEDAGIGIAVDSGGHVYVTGRTSSSAATFPVSVGPDLTHNGGSDAFVANVNILGTALVYAGYVGGSGEDTGHRIAIDSAGNAFVIGSTDSAATTFPATIGPDLTFNGGASDAFVAKIGDSAVPATRTPFDFDGDGRADISTFRPDIDPSNNFWYIKQSFTSNTVAMEWGNQSDKLAPADYDGDGKTDIAVWRDEATNPDKANFYILHTSNSAVRVEQFGRTGDVPSIVGDWDGDGKADPAVYRPGTGGGQSFFYYRPSSQPTVDFTTIHWGIGGDVPMHGDFDGDGKLDAAVSRPNDNTWYIRQSSNGQARYDMWGVATDKFVPADYDGDGKTDLAVFRNGTWYIRRSSDNQSVYQNFGMATDQLTPADYDGDGRADIALFRDGTWYVLQSQSASVQNTAFGSPGDRAVPTAYQP